MTNHAKPSSALTVADVRAVPVFIYGLIDPRDGVVRYVGKSARPEARLVHHRCSGATSVRAWFAELLALGLTPTLTILSTVQPGEDASLYERIAIGSHVARGIRLLNVMGVEGERMSRARCVARNRGAAELIRVGITQIQLAKKTGCSQSVVSQWMNGSQLPSAPLRAKLEDTFGIYWRLWDQPVDVASPMSESA